jgi:hypothetical protein
MGGFLYKKIVSFLFLVKFQILKSMGLVVPEHFQRPFHIHLSHFQSLTTS